MGDLRFNPPVNMTAWTRRLLYAGALAAACSDERRHVREEGGANRGPVVVHMLRNAAISVPAPWCAAAVQDWTDSAAAALDVPNPLDDVSREALVADYAAWATKHGRVIDRPSLAPPGALVLFRFSGVRWDHIGLLRFPPASDAAGTLFSTIEGNTNGSGSREGDGVYRRTRKLWADVMFVGWADA